jgi:hypothetical protein
MGQRVGQKTTNDGSRMGNPRGEGMEPVTDCKDGATRTNTGEWGEYEGARTKGRGTNNYYETDSHAITSYSTTMSRPKMESETRKENKQRHKGLIQYSQTDRTVHPRGVQQMVQLPHQPKKSTMAK